MTDQSRGWSPASTPALEPGDETTTQRKRIENARLLHGARQPARWIDRAGAGTIVAAMGRAIGIGKIPSLAKPIRQSIEAHEPVIPVDEPKTVADKEKLDASLVTSPTRT